MTAWKAEDDKALEPRNVDVDGSGIVEAGASDSEMLCTGRISREQYIERAVESAIAHLRGHVDAERLSTMQELLRSQLQNDPLLSKLVSTVEGSPRPSADPQQSSSRDPSADGT